MKTSQDVYNRILWDPDHKEEDYLIGYRDFDKTVEIKLPNWTPSNDGGEIPWHRVEYIKNTDQLVVWHRTKRIDAIFHTGENSAYIDEEHRLKSFANVYMKPHTVDVMGNWTGNTIYGVNNFLEHFTILSWNILSDEFKPDLDHETRYRQICDVIKGYDIICLQEVTRTFLAILREQEWSRDYWISDSNGGTFDRNMGIVTMSKISCSNLYMLCDTKNSLITEFQICGYNMGVINLHLTSDHHGESSKRRSIMLNRIRRLTKEDLNRIWVILGERWV
jgi:poly(A) polymerase